MELKYLIREPETITAKTDILFMFHGYGSNEEDLFAFVPTLPADWIIVSFRAPLQSEYEGFSWYDIDFNDPEKFVETTQANASLNAILDHILKISNQYGLTDNQTHLCGFSQGGILCYALALRLPDLFTRIAILSAYPEPKIIGEINKDSKKLEKLRFFISHGTDDAVIPLEWGQKAAEFLYDLGCFFSFREYMSGHGVNQKNYMDLMAFFNSNLMLK